MSPTALGALMLVVLVIPLGLVYVASRRTEGVKAARRVLVLSIVAMVAVGSTTLALMSAFPRTWLGPLLLVLEGSAFLVEVAMLLTWSRRKRRLGNLLHELPRGFGQKVFLLLSVTGLIGLVWATVTVGMPKSAGDWALFGLLLVTLPAFSVEGLSRWRFGERGILHFRRFVPWVRVKSYRMRRLMARQSPRSAALL